MLALVIELARVPLTDAGNASAAGSVATCLAVLTIGIQNTGRKGPKSLGTQRSGVQLEMMYWTVLGGARVPKLGTKLIPEGRPQECKNSEPYGDRLQFG
jgi:hypothetical protein